MSLDHSPAPAPRRIPTPSLELHRLVPEAYVAVVQADAAAWAALEDRRLAELLKVRVSQLNGCAFCLDLHTRGALAAGASMRTLSLLAAWQESPLFDPRERAALALAEATVRSGRPAPDAQELGEAREHFSDRQVAALMVGVGVAGLWNRMALASGLAFPVDEQEAGRLAARLGAA